MVYVEGFDDVFCHGLIKLLSFLSLTTFEDDGVIIFMMIIFQHLSIIDIVIIIGIFIHLSCSLCHCRVACVNICSSQSEYFDNIFLEHTLYSESM